MDFLIIVSALGPGWSRFGFIKGLGASEKFVGGWWGGLSNYSISSWPWLAKIWLMQSKGPMPGPRSLTKWR